MEDAEFFLSLIEAPNALRYLVDLPLVCFDGRRGGASSGEEMSSLDAE